MAKKNTKKILLTGGGTGGSVSPLLAIYESIINYELRITNYQFLWVGTSKGIEREMVEAEKIKYISIPSGKLRRYFSWQNFFDPIFILAGFLKSLYIVLKHRPDIVISAGSFVSVPVVWSAWLLGVPVFIHQQDVRPGLANKLMAPFADIVTVTFEKSLSDYKKKGEWIGNMTRRSLEDTRNNNQISNKFKFSNSELPTILVMGGGTGAGFLNNIVAESADKLKDICNVILLCGKQKKPNFQFSIFNFQLYEFLNQEEMSKAMQVAQMMVTRAGLGTLTEIAYLKKPAIIIPMPDTHQEDNAKIFKEKNAALVLDQKKLNAEEFVENIKNLLDDKKKQEEYSKNISNVMKQGANERVVEIIEEIINK